MQNNLELLTMNNSTQTLDHYARLVILIVTVTTYGGVLLASGLM